jgi:hypothetical protein
VAEPIGPVDKGEDEDVAGDEDLKKAPLTKQSMQYCHYTF